MNGKFHDTSWIVDSGASRHVTCLDTWLFDVHHISKCPVGLPNGKCITATKEGSIRLTDKIILKNVLFVPDLRCNLISVSQLINDMQYTVHFNFSMCTIQGQSRELIGTSVRRDGLFYFEQSPVVQHVSITHDSSTLELWHKRMGHLPKE